MNGGMDYRDLTPCFFCRARMPTPGLHRTIRHTCGSHRGKHQHHERVSHASHPSGTRHRRGSPHGHELRGVVSRPRLLYWFATFPMPVGPAHVMTCRKRASPWDRRRAPRVDGRTPSFLRSRQRAGPNQGRITEYRARPIYLQHDTQHWYRWDLMRLTGARNHPARILGRADYVEQYPTGQSMLQIDLERHQSAPRP